MVLSFFGFLELYPADGAPAPGLGPDVAVLTLANPFTTRVAVAVDDAPIGDLAPRGCGAIVGIAAGDHTVRLRTPDGFVRTLAVAAVVGAAPDPDARSLFLVRSSPLCGR